MKIRLGTRKDTEEVIKYLKEMWLMHCDNEPEFVSKKKIGNYNTDKIKKYLDNCFNNSGKSYLLISEENGELAGFLKIDVIRVQKFFVENRALYLDDIYVKEKYRKRGVAKALYHEAEKIAKTRKLKWLKTRIYEFNKPAQAMAKSIGLRPIYSEYFKVL